MKRVALVFVLAACGGSTQHSKVEEVPIENANGTGGGGALPPDEVGDAGGATSTVAIPSGTAPPGVGPQSLDVQQDAGSTTGPTSTAPHFVQRAGGLTERECTDVVMGFAKIMAKENKSTAPSATDLPKDPIYGQMLADCGQSTTKKQKTCAMAARTSAGWKKCME
jgi:hypothetical protein